VQRLRRAHGCDDLSDPTAHSEGSAGDSLLTSPGPRVAS
jgi:hypothetical protein